MIKQIFYTCFVFFALGACKDRDRQIGVKVSFKGEGYGKFEICFIERGMKENNFQNLNYHLIATTKNGIIREVEKSIFQSCIEQDFIQYKLGTYKDWELEELKTQFVPGNIKSVKVEIYYDGEYKTPFITKELKNL